MSCLAKAIVSWTVEFLMGGRLLVLLENKKEMLNPRRQKTVINLCFVPYAHLYARVCGHLLILIFLVVSTPPPTVGPYSVWRQYYYFVGVVFTLQGGLACCGSWGRKQSDTTERLS